jgi:hypothetical protein
MPAGDPDGSAKLLGQGPIRMIDYWKEVKKVHGYSPAAAAERTRNRVDSRRRNLLCLGATRTPVENIGLLVRETHTLDPDRFIACRGATLDRHRKHCGRYGESLQRNDTQSLQQE